MPPFGPSTLFPIRSEPQENSLWKCGIIPFSDTHSLPMQSYLNKTFRWSGSCTASSGFFFEFSRDFCMVQMMRARDHPFLDLSSVLRLSLLNHSYPQKSFRKLSAVSYEDLDSRGERLLAKGKKRRRVTDAWFSRLYMKNALPPTVYTSKQYNSVFCLPFFTRSATFRILFLRVNFQIILLGIFSFSQSFYQRRRYNNIATICIIRIICFDIVVIV